jgi:hypothetical protein
MSDPHLPERINPAGMARMLGMSRARLYQLLKDGTFPSPCRDTDGRAFFDREQQAQILTAYRMNTGVNGKSVFFRPKAVRRMPSRKPPPRPETSSADAYRNGLLAALRAMGLSHLTKRRLDSAIRTLYPAGLLEDRPLLVRSLFLHLHGQDSTDSPGR